MNVKLLTEHYLEFISLKGGCTCQNAILLEITCFSSYHKRVIILILQSELPRPIIQNSVESDQGCTSRIYFDNAGDNMTLTLYNVTLTNSLNEVYVFSIKCRYSDILLKKHKLHLFC